MQGIGLTRRVMNVRADQLHVRRYELTLDLTQSSTARVSTRVEFEWRSPISSTFADLDAQLIGAELNGRTLSKDAYTAERLRLDELDPVNTLSVETEVPFADDGKGICEYVDAQDGTRYVHTKGMPFVAPRILPCFQGANRAPFDIKVMAPAGWSCVSHTAAVNAPAEGEGGLWRFATTPAMPPEQLVVASGPLTRSSLESGGSSIEIALYGRRAIADELGRTDIARWLAALVDVETRLLGVDYPFNGLNILLMPNWSALGGSSPGIIALNEILLHESLRAEDRRHVIWALAHELAHAWFGSLVLERRWESPWLAEGAATYICYRAMEELVPEMHPWALFHLLEEADAHAVDGEEGIHSVAVTPDLDKPLQPPPGETYALRSQIVYVKPAALIRELAADIGSDALLRGFAAYLMEHTDDDPTAEDLIAHWSEACGQDLTGWASEWLKTPGINTLETRIISDDGIVREASVLQSGYPLRTHNLTVAVYDVVQGTLVAREPTAITVVQAVTPIPEIGGSRTPDVVLLNAPPTTYAKVRLDNRTRHAVGLHMHELSPAVRATCWVAGFEMVADGLMTNEEFGEWVDRHSHLEADRAVRDLLASKAS